jgi:hypothetical protein
LALAKSLCILAKAIKLLFYFISPAKAGGNSSYLELYQG